MVVLADIARTVRLVSLIFHSTSTTAAILYIVITLVTANRMPNICVDRKSLFSNICECCAAENQDSELLT